LFARTVAVGVSLRWEQADLTGVEGFIVYRRVVSEKKAMRIAQVSDKENQFTDRQVKPGSLYVYTITVLGAGGESAPSDERTVRK
jgi:fibronectin type 3 domain-containing protein